MSQLVGAMQSLKKDDIIILGKVEMVTSGLEGRDAYGVKPINSDPTRKEVKTCLFQMRYN